MAGPAVGDARARAAQLLMQDREAIASSVTAALYAEAPSLLQRYGASGRAKCLQDMRYNIEHLIPAVDLADDDMFVRYVRWLDGLLRARNVATRDVVRCLELLRDDCARRYPTAESSSIASVIDAGLRSLAAT